MRGGGGPIRFHDHHPQGVGLREAVMAGLATEPKAIPPKFFYDERGSRLFDAICRQPEYYLPGCERRILSEYAGEIAGLAGQRAVVIEPGAGNGEKVRLLLEALRPAAYLPMDISGAYLRASAEALAADYPWLEVQAICADFSTDIALPDELPPGRRLVFFPGSSLGNFDPDEARDLLGRLRRLAGAGGMLLIGVDTKKPRELLDAAYNDRGGVTAAFNLNLLERINRELGADFDLAGFRHEAFYDVRRGRVEMHLVSRVEQEVRIDGCRFRFGAGERLHTECSYKYAPDEFVALAGAAGLTPAGQWSDAKGWFGVYLLAVA